MADLLSTEEHFEDRIEITGYVTAGAAGIFLLVFFGMIFFFQPVRSLPATTQLLALASAAFVLWIGFYIPRGKNWARLLYRTFFLWFGTYAYFKSLEQAHWIFLPVLLYCAYLLWVLGHPVAIQNFRLLKPHESRQKPVAHWMSLHTTVLLFTICITGLKGLMVISSTESDPLYNPDQGMLLLFVSSLLFFQLFFFRRLKNWARWCLALTVFIIGLAGVPDTVSTEIQKYTDYWKLLAKVFYCFGLALYLVFSPRIRQAFRTPAKAG